MKKTRTQADVNLPVFNARKTVDLPKTIQDLNDEKLRKLFEKQLQAYKFNMFIERVKRVLKGPAFRLIHNFFAMYGAIYLAASIWVEVCGSCG